MSKFISSRQALIRVLEDDKAPTKLRIEALRQIPHPPLCVMRRLIAETATRVTPVPSRLKAIVTLAYVREMAFRKAFGKSKAKTETAQVNALGI
jgi:hypothetical protein